MKMTITEALAEIKTLNARIEKRRQTTLSYIVRDARLRDPLEADGGSAEFVRKERQAVGDLEDRIVAIRTAIQTVNQQEKITVADWTHTIAEWLNWRREVAPGARQFLAQIANQIQMARSQVTRSGGRVGEVSEAKPGDFVVAVSETKLAEELEKIEGVLGELDGKLSLANATMVIEI